MKFVWHQWMVQLWVIFCVKKLISAQMTVFRWKWNGKNVLTKTTLAAKQAIFLLVLNCSLLRRWVITCRKIVFDKGMWIFTFSQICQLPTHFARKETNYKMFKNCKKTLVDILPKLFWLIWGQCQVGERLFWDF